MKILIFIPTLRTGGAERVASILANNWIKRDDIKVTICLLYKEGMSYEVSDKIKIISIDEQFKSVTKFSIIFQLRKVIKSENPNCIQSFLTEYNIICLLSTLGLNKNIYVSDRANPLVHRGFIVENLRKLLYPLAKGIIAQTTLAKEVLFKNLNHSNIRVINNPTRIPVLVPAKKQKIILNVGRLIPEKGQEELINAFKEAELPQEWKLQIVGDGPLKEQLSNKIINENIQNVELMGQSDNVEHYYNQSSIFAFTSSSEGYPNAIAEAMSYGLPVVSYNCEAGPRDLIKHSESGFLVNVHNTESFVKYLSLLVNDDDLRDTMGNAGREKIKSNSESNISETWLNFITQ